MSTNHEGPSRKTRPTVLGAEVTTWDIGITVLVGLVIIAALGLVLATPLLSTQLRLEVGDVSPTDIRAPDRVSFESSILTQQARDRAAAAVSPVYDPLDPRIRRQQIDSAEKVLDYIDVLRNDPYSSLERKVQLLGNVPSLSLPAPTISRTLVLDEGAWQAVWAETLYVTDQAMRREIREDQLAQARRTLPALVTSTLSDDQSEIVVQLARNFVVPNSLYNTERTQELQAQARGEIKPVMRTIEKDEIILREGDLVDNLDLEALERVGLLQSRVERWSAVGTVLLIAVVVLVTGLYLLRVEPRFWANHRHAILLGLLIGFFAFLGKLMIPGYSLFAFLYPVAAMSMLLTALLGPQSAVVATLIISVFVGLLGGGSLEPIVYTLAAGLVATLSLWRVERLNDFLRAGLYVAVTNLVVIASFRLLNQDYARWGPVPLAAAGIGNGALATSLTLAGFYALGNLFRITTTLQLMELARPTHPLLRQLQMRAPGTYHHSLIISNMVEHAAERIGADALLVRVAAYYHDVGKMLRPYFFIENQIDGVNVHDRLDPQTSAQIVISHVADGLELARKYKLPQKIADFIPQHHGDSIAKYFYREAIRQNDGQEVDPELFRYPGPKPQTREAAIMMLADGVEATVRANRPKSAEEIKSLAEKVVNGRIADGQLDECNLTLRDLAEIKAAFVDILRGAYHPRIQYPPETEQERQARMEPALASVEEPGSS